MTTKKNILTASAAILLGVQDGAALNLRMDTGGGALRPDAADTQVTAVEDVEVDPTAVLNRHYREFVTTHLSQPGIGDDGQRYLQPNGTGEIEFAKFLRAFEKPRGGTEMGEDDCEITDAFCACGGGIQANEKEGIAENLKEGFVEQGPLAAIIRDFGMTIKVGRLFEELDKDRDGKLSFTEFAALFQ